MQIISQYIYDNGKKRYKLDHEKKNDKTNQPLSLWSSSLWFYVYNEVKEKVYVWFLLT